jgi:hypothetical protein
MELAIETAVPLAGRKALAVAETTPISRVAEPAVTATSTMVMARREPM